MSPPSLDIKCVIYVKEGATLMDKLYAIYIRNKQGIKGTKFDMKKIVGYRIVL